jgi:hypothetical protein
MLAILIGGLMLGGLLVYSYTTGQELPLWPALAVVAVNLYGAWRMFSEARARRQARTAARQTGDASR